MSPANVSGVVVADLLVYGATMIDRLGHAALVDGGAPPSSQRARTRTLLQLTEPYPSSGLGPRVLEPSRRTWK